MHTHKVLTWALVIVVLVIGGAFAWHRYATRVIVHEVVGRVMEKSPTMLTMEGFYNTTGYPNADNSIRIIKVLITPTTKITKISYRVPTAAEAPNGFHLESLPAEYASGSLDEVGQGTNQVPTVIRSDENIYGKDSFTASSVEYKVMVFPK